MGTDKRFDAISRSTIGVIFLGTPFRGTSPELHEVTLVRIAAASDAGVSTTHELAKFLQNNDNDRGELDELVQKFFKIKDHKMYRFPVICFYETLQTNLSSIIKRLPQKVAEKLSYTNGSTVVREFHDVASL